MVAALYAASTIALGPISYGPIQLRIPEILKSLVIWRPHLIAAFVIGNFRGTFDWRAFEDKVRVPPQAREAILRIGLHGATGEISFDQVKLEAGK